MTRRPASSFLIRLDPTDGSVREGTITSVRTGERAPFAELPEMVRIIEAWTSADEAPPKQEEADT